MAAYRRVDDLQSNEYGKSFIIFISPKQVERQTNKVDKTT